MGQNSEPCIRQCPERLRAERFTGVRVKGSKSLYVLVRKPSGHVGHLKVYLCEVVFVLLLVAGGFLASRHRVLQWLRTTAEKAESSRLV